MSSQPPLDGELGYASLDLERATRCGFPEVVFAEGKTNEWLAGALHRLIEVGQDTFATRVNAEQAEHLAIRFPTAEQDRLARTFWFPQSTPKPGFGDVLVVTAGTGDLPVAQEALVTARVMGANAEMIVDVGVAGLHRILSKRDRLAKADVIIVVAGMDGALPSVVGGLVSCPVIACPTSIGYGASFGGIAALLTMLNSCSAGVAVVNIDGGFKAGSIAARMVKRIVNSRNQFVSKVMANLIRQNILQAFPQRTVISVETSNELNEQIGIVTGFDDLNDSEFVGKELLRLRRNPLIFEILEVSSQSFITNLYVRKGKEEWTSVMRNELNSEVEFATIPARIPLADIYRGVELVPDPPPYAVR